MGRSRNRNRRPSAPDLAKSARTLPAGTVAVDATELVRAISAAGSLNAGAVDPLPRNPLDNVPFGPGFPLIPAAINPPRPDTGRPEPRRFDYPTSWNLPGGASGRLVPWKLLRDFADQVDMVRRAIEVRKANATGLEWDFRPSKRAIQQVMRDNGMVHADAEKLLRDSLINPIAALREFWSEPDRGNGMSWTDWIMCLLEEHFVLDAAAIYPRLTRGGAAGLTTGAAAVFAMEILDGSTVKPLLDDRGSRPQPPFPAYQQILHGFPRGEFTAMTDEAGAVTGFASDELTYAVRFRRSWTPYGYSNTEQAMVSGDIYLRRQGWMRAEYTEGAMPQALAEVDADWTPEQLRAYERIMNAELAGDVRERHRLKLVPKGFSLHEQSDAAERYSSVYDEYLVRLVCSHFDVLPTEIGVSNPRGGMGGKGHQDGEADTIQRRQRPLLEWVSELVTRLSRRYLDAPGEVEFAFLGMEAEDENMADEVADRRIKRGVLRLNEDRDRLGLPRFDFPEADEPFIVTQNGPVFLDGAIAQAAEAVQTASATVAGEPVVESTPAGTAKVDEAHAYVRWAKRRPVASRPFAFHALTSTESLALADAVTAGGSEVRAVIADLTKAADNGARPAPPRGAQGGGDALRLSRAGGSAWADLPD